MGWENIHFLMEKFITDISLMEKYMEMANTFGQMVHLTREIMLMVNVMVMEYFNGVMELFIKGHL